MAVQDVGSIVAARAWLPYCGAAPTPIELPWRWNLDPLVLVALGGAALACVLLLPGRRERWLGAAGVGVLAVSFVSPLCALSSALFSARVVHHALLVAVAAPLFAFALSSFRIRGPGLSATTGLHAVVFWIWHAPGPYAWALSHDLVYWIMQATLFGSALLFWMRVQRAGGLAAAGALLATMLQMGLLGALLTFAPQPFYAPHQASTDAFGLSALADQQLAGVIMWAPMAGIYLLVALALVGRSLGAERDEMVRA